MQNLTSHFYGILNEFQRCLSAGIRPYVSFAFMSHVGKLTEGCQNYCDLPITQQFPIDPYSAATSSNRITSTLFIGEDVQHFKRRIERICKYYFRPN